MKRDSGYLLKISLRQLHPGDSMRKFFLSQSLHTAKIPSQTKQEIRGGERRRRE